MKTENANGRTACLIRTDDKYCIRIYHESRYSMFKDYDIKHNDLFFVINDEDAHLFEDGDNRWIDYAPIE